MTVLAAWTAGGRGSEPGGRMSSGTGGSGAVCGITPIRLSTELLMDGETVGAAVMGAEGGRDENS